MEIKKIRELEELEGIGVREYVEALKKPHTVIEVQDRVAKEVDDDFFGLPLEVKELSGLEQSVLFYYTDPSYINPYTNEKTYMDVVQSYISAALDNNQLRGLYRREVTENNRGEEVVKVSISDTRYYEDVRIKAMKLWTNGNLQNLVYETLNIRMGKLDKRAATEALSKTILHDAFNSKIPADKNANRKMAMKILGIGEEKQINFVNVYQKHGGRENNQIISKNANNPLIDLSDIIDQEDD